LEVVESEGVHSYPGLSLNFSGPLPRQVGLYLDGDGPLPATSLDPSEPSARRLSGAMPAGLAYELRTGARALMLNPGAGLHAALALAAGAAEVDVAIDEPLVLEVLRGPYAGFTFGLARDPRLRWLPTTSRGALSGNGNYDVIEFALTDPFRPVASGAFSLNEEYDTTVEALRAALGDLAPDGILVWTRWLTTPPAESLRAWATLLEAMKLNGLEPEGRVAVYRTLRTSTALASPRPWTPAELSTIRGFLQRNGFDPIALPGLSVAESNRFNRIPDNPYPTLFGELLRDPQALEADFPYQISPVTDDRPYYFHFFRWQQTPEVLAAFGRTWQPFGGSGYLVLLALLALVVALAVAVALAPLVRGRRQGHLSFSGGLYFACLAAGFMFIELALLQRFTLSLQRPPLAFAAVVSVLLLASGIGSRVADRVRTPRPVLGVAILALAAAVLVPASVSASLGWSLAGRAGLTVLAILPIGFLMGMPFPLGMRWLAAGDTGRVGWAWSINGAASAVAGVLAAMLMIDLGSRVLLVLGGLAYLAAWLLARRGRWSVVSGQSSKRSNEL
jgi:hypothetical protein